MKNKSISDKIRASVDLVKSVKKNRNAGKLTQVKKPMQTLSSDLEVAVSLQKAVQKLKKDLKTRKKELEIQVEKLSESRKAVKKVVKKGGKVAPVVKKTKRPEKPARTKPQAKANNKPVTENP
jgi:predicted  nucleic acid-binding Zn-ribbon protein